MHIDHPELLARIADGNEAAMKHFFQSFYPRLRYFILDVLKDDAEAQDIAQEAISIFWNRREHFRHATIREAGAFLFTVARNKCHDHRKHLQVKSSKQGEIIYSQETIEDILEAKIIKEDLFNRVYAEILTLPPSQVQLLKMIFVEDLSTPEIAERLGITPNNVRNQKARALEKLRLLLEKRRLMIFFSFFY
ncbi:RNA polymerase sigma factor [Chitinophaga arvensicola]|uniref:RNA polymerase sigma-70 factor, ECF subfamily n=1 Tax=Chitinophaga arvensicola TaxID=29529 RepID=A0A1I0SA93_9BACT|nr:sigma-70 family RNA polymerase sigma factor [Chitinophaga arvensicola]SEW53374.1 RNA polymerase sigma-70 factor, ECF subfamily [Chitinophaga arvensicola]